MSWADLWWFYRYLPADSALRRELDPDHWITPEIQMLREIKHGLDVLAWMKTEGATKRPPRNYPERLPLTAAEVAAAQEKEAPVYDAEPIEVMADFLGWPRPAKN